MSSSWEPEPKRSFSNAFCGILPGGRSLVLGSEVSLATRFTRVESFLMGTIPCPYFPTEDTYERRIMVDKEEVTLVVYDIWEQVRTNTWLRAGDEPQENWGRAKPGGRLVCYHLREPRPTTVCISWQQDPLPSWVF